MSRACSLVTPHEVSLALKAMVSHVDFLLLGEPCSLRNSPGSWSTSVLPAECGQFMPYGGEFASVFKELSLCIFLSGDICVWLV